MKLMVSSVLVLLASYGAAICQSPKPPPPILKDPSHPVIKPPVTTNQTRVLSVSIKFITNDDNLDFDTGLWVNFQCSDNVFASYVSNQRSGLDLAKFSIHHSTDWISVPMTSTLTTSWPSKAIIPRCTTSLNIDPHGHDTWRFDYWVRLFYTDGQTSEFHYDNHALSQKIRKNVFPLN